MSQDNSTNQIGCIAPLPVKEGVEYRHVPGFSGYCVGTDGSLWSCLVPHKQTRKYAASWHLKKMWCSRDGYYHVSLWGDDGKDHRLLAHSVILITFVGPRPKGYDSLHGNGNPSDNRLENWRWGTRKENVEDARRHGTLARRERSGSAKLTELKAKAIKILRAAGFSQRDVAEVIGVTQSTISAIDNGHRWSDEDAPLC